MFKKIRKKLLAALTDKAEKQQPMTLLEKEFLRECGLTVDNLSLIHIWEFAVCTDDDSSAHRCCGIVWRLPQQPQSPSESARLANGKYHCPFGVVSKCALREKKEEGPRFPGAPP